MGVDVRHQLAQPGGGRIAGLGRAFVSDVVGGAEPEQVRHETLEPEREHPQDPAIRQDSEVTPPDRLVDLTLQGGVGAVCGPAQHAQHASQKQVRPVGSLPQAVHAA